MRNNINIKYNDQIFPYIVEYVKNASDRDGSNKVKKEYVSLYKSEQLDTVRILKDDIKYYRDKNDWYCIENQYDNALNINDYINDDTEIYTTNLKIYIPTHSISKYIHNIKYAVTVNTWINGVKIDLGSFLFSPTDTYAIPFGSINNGNNEYYECINFDIVDPFYILYSDTWDILRKRLCNEREYSNDTSSALYISLHVVKEYNNSYINYEDYISGYTNFVISESNDFLSLKLEPSNNPFGLKFSINMNSVYDSFIDYLKETYNLIKREPTKSYSENTILYDTIEFDILIKNKDSIVADSFYKEYNFENDIIENNGVIIQNILWEEIPESNSIKKFFNSWDNFEEGWSIVGSITIYENITELNNESEQYEITDTFELFSIVSNEIPITQELFSIYTKGTEKIIDIEDMIINTYNVVNKIENKIIQIDRPNESKSNIVQPVFFRVKDTETLTLHPAVTENISINLDDYKSKVKSFILQIGEIQFDQIGANSYGILFKIAANTLPKVSTNGIYYILDENKELITTGKYNCVI